MDDLGKPVEDAEPTGKPTPDSWRRERWPPPTPSPVGQKWLAENQEAIDAFNAWYEEHGSPLDEYRMF